MTIKMVTKYLIGNFLALVLSLMVAQSNGQSIKVISILEAPFLMPGETPGTYIGYIKDLAEKLFPKLGKSYEFRNPSGLTYQGMITELTEKKGDIILAPLTVTKHRSELVDFSMPFMEAQLAIVQKRPSVNDVEELETKEDNEDEDDIDDDDVLSEHPWFDPFSIWLWLVFALSSIILLFVIFFIEKFVGNKKLPSSKNEKLFQGFSTKVFGTPRCFATRFLQILFWIFLCVIFAVYTGNFAADRIVNLINDSYKTAELPINSPEQLLKLSHKIKFGFLNNSSTNAYFKESTDPIISEINKIVTESGTIISSYEDGKDRVRRANGTFAFIMESPAAKYAATLEPCDLAIGKKLFGIKRGFSIAIRKPQSGAINQKQSQSLLEIEEINIKLLEMKEDGILDALENKWFKEASECRVEEKIDIKVDPNQYEPLCFETMGGFLILLGLSVFIVLIIGIIEVILISKA